MGIVRGEWAYKETLISRDIDKEWAVKRLIIASIRSKDAIECELDDKEGHIEPHKRTPYLNINLKNL